MSSTTTNTDDNPPPPPPPTKKNALADLVASRTDGKVHLLLAASGSVATIKLAPILAALAAHHPPSALSVRLVLTTSAARFLAGQSPEQPPLASLLALPCVDGLYLDDDEWGRGAAVGPEGVWVRGAPVLHIELRRWADLMAVVPLSANTLAKICGGICDNLLTSVVRAWDADGRVDGRRKRILVAPAMNVSLSPPSPSSFSPPLVVSLSPCRREVLASSPSRMLTRPRSLLQTAMWLHPITARQIRVLSEDWGVREADDGTIESGWFEVLRPQEKSLACGDVGDGAMKEWSEIVSIIEARLGLAAPSEGSTS